MMNQDDIILELKNITKIYPGVRALDDVSISLKRGEVHALVGENGAGKSTLIKIITGAIHPTYGSIIYKGKTYKHFSPIEAISLGISVIYQEFNLIPYLTVAENIFYGREIMKGMVVDKRETISKTQALLNNFGININPKARVKDLGVAHQQIIEIIKAISRNIDVLIMDEPTAPLTKKETEVMFNLVRQLKEKGVTIIYISHRLEEVSEICDRVTVLRDGKYIATRHVSEINRKELISMMVGRKLGESYPEKGYCPEENVLEVRNLSTDKLQNISFELKKGEILGFGGLVGAGRTELARAIFAADKKKTGEIYLEGRIINPRSPKDAIRLGIGLVPEDRKQQGVLLKMSVKANISYSCLDKLSKFIFIKKSKENKMVEEITSELRIKTPSLDQKTVNLSGGNQQKVVLAKCIATKSKILIFDEPTRGIDVGTKQEIYNLMKNLAESGKGIIMISSEMPELLGMSDRIIVMREAIFFFFSSLIKSSMGSFWSHCSCSFCSR
jgi:ribose transport system ATP-binding protein